MKLSPLSARTVPAGRVAAGAVLLLAVAGTAGSVGVMGPAALRSGTDAAVRAVADDPWTVAPSKPADDPWTVVRAAKPDDPWTVAPATTADDPWT
ncbi:hypothetical protein AB0L33_27640 [Streptomyces sp. NPDC052299]|uniref:hypothetical protein n=1 Tax=Streptomyces sp. NPDC052299 TaxID=3155054 RepID=UPI0034428292